MKEYYSMSPEESRVNAKASQFRNREKGYTLHMDEKEIVYESKENTGEVSIRTIEDLDVALPSLCETVYDALGAKNLEATYQRALVVELESTGLEGIQSERSIRIMYKGHCIGTRRADLILQTSDGEAIVELKAVGKLTSEHVKQLEYYMVHFNIDVGYLINFPHESGFPPVDSLEFAFQQTHISGPSALDHPISDAILRRRIGGCVSTSSSPHIIKLTKVLCLNPPALATPPPMPAASSRKKEEAEEGKGTTDTTATTGGTTADRNTVDRNTADRNSTPPSAITAPAFPQRRDNATSFGIAESTGKPCKVCIRQNRYCKYHVNQDPNRKW